MKQKRWQLAPFERSGQETGSAHIKTERSGVAVGNYHGRRDSIEPPNPDEPEPIRFSTAGPA
jgi:hypothetical protein